jgi:succinyl-diaminopimelate desuccinylase
MKEKILKKAEEYREDIVRTTQELIKIPSVEAEAVGEYPYGENVYQALKKALNISSELGLKYKNIDNYAAHIEIGEAEEIFALLCHLDVVPEGSNWTYPPYAAEVHEGKIYGRGSTDDKGPTAAALFALKIVDDLGIKLNKKVRLILGTNEESGMASLKYYFDKEKMPELAFSPDAVFPVIHAEKGILDLKFSSDLKAEDKNGLKLISINGGSAANMVPDQAEAKVKGITLDELEKILQDIDYDQEDLELASNNNSITLKYNGISAHASTPEEGKNAISYLINILAELPFENKKTLDFLNFYKDKIGVEYYGESIGCADEDDIPTKLTFNTGIIRVNNDKAEFIVNIRYPVKSNAEKVIKDIKEKIDGSQINLEEMSNAEPLYIPKDDPFIKKLMNAYQEFTGDDSEAIAIGGGTYARLVKKGAAFGPLFPGREMLAHQKDENVLIDDLVKAAAIYAKAIIDIAGE